VWFKRYLKKHDIEILTQFWNDKNKEKDTERKRSNNQNFNQQECDEILDKVRNYLETDRPYTNPEFKMADLAYAINCPTQTLSYVLNHYLKKSYSDFINEYRVEAFKQLAKNADFSKYTILSLAEKCGFGSEAAFFRIFKKVTEMTPSEYVKSVER
jgi:AraC-like DNA-binding protein